MRNKKKAVEETNPLALFGNALISGLGTPDGIGALLTLGTVISSAISYANGTAQIEEEFRDVNQKRP